MISKPFQAAWTCLRRSKVANFLVFSSILAAVLVLSSFKASSNIYLSPCDIQGKFFSSPYVGQSVRTQGVVFADLDETSKRGFFIQEENCDGDPSSSDGVFVYLGSRSNIVNPGDRVEVVGLVQEYYGMTEITTSPEFVSILSSGNRLPEPHELNPPRDNSLASSYMESLEGMHTALHEAIVVGPTSQRDETWVVNANLDIRRVLRNDPLGTGQVVCIDDAGSFEIEPEANVGDNIHNLRGALDFSYGLYRLQLIDQPILVRGDQAFQIPSLTCGFSVATYNARNLFDPVDDPDKSDPVVSGAEYLRRLTKLASAINEGMAMASVIALQEVENGQVLQDLVAQQELRAPYGFVLEEGPDGRGIDVGLLYRQDRLVLRSSAQRQGCTTLNDGLGPDGNGDVINPHNTLTCDTDGDAILDGNRLFSRPPLLVHVEVYPTSCSDSVDAWLIINHWKSKIEDDGNAQYTLPRRIEQAEFVGSLYEEIITTNPGARVIVLGDLNDYPDAEPLRALEKAGLENLIAYVPSRSRYTYIYQGLSQVLDHILISPALKNEFVFAAVAHFNADYAEEYARWDSTLLRNSDHDPVLAWFGKLDRSIFLPLTRNR